MCSWQRSFSILTLEYSRYTTKELGCTSPSSEANILSKVNKSTACHRVRKKPLPDPIFRNLSSTFHSTSLRYTSILSSHLHRDLPGISPFDFATTALCASDLSHTCYSSSPYHNHVFHRSNNTLLNNCRLFETSPTLAVTLTTKRFSHCSFYAFTLHSSLSELNGAIILSDSYHLPPPVC